MKNYLDFFPETPEGFHLRVEETLASLEEKDMENIKLHSRRMVAALAAILIIALAATAVAVVQGDALRTRMTESGSETLAAQVQDVHATDAEDGFSFTIDEILWQDENLYVSYTASVPEDGNVYLVSPTEMELNGESINSTYGIDAEFFVQLFAVGGEYGASTSQIMQMQVPEEIAKSSENQFSSKCVFMQPAKPLAKVTNEEYYALFTEPDAYGNENQRMKSADVLYYTDTTEAGDAVPVVYLHPYPEVNAVMDGHERVSAEALESTGIARTASTREISIPIRKTENGHIRFNDAAQRIFDMDGYSIEITKLGLSQFRTEFEAHIRKESGEITEWTDAEPYGQYYSLCDADGSDFGNCDVWSIGGGEVIVTESGETVYCIEGCSEGIYDLEELQEIYLAPGIYDENGVFIRNDMTRAIKITPVYNPDLPETAQESEIDFAETDDLSS